MRGSRIREYSPRMYTRQGSVLIFFSFLLLAAFGFLVVCICVIAAESRVKWKNARVMGFTVLRISICNIKTKNEISDLRFEIGEKTDLRLEICEKNIISRIFVVKKTRGNTNIRILVLIFVLQ